jgi:hypothetical protein
MRNAGKRRLHLTQQRFLKDGIDASDATLWLVPVTLTWQGATSPMSFVMQVRRQRQVDCDGY